MSLTIQKSYYYILTFIFISVLLNDIVFAVSCKELDSPEKIKSFMNESHLSSPFLQKNVSVTVILDACEGKVCKSKSKREAQKETLHILRLDNKRRIFAEKGPNAPTCVIQRVRGATFVPAVALYPMKTVEVSLLMKARSFLVQTLIHPILSLSLEM